MRGVGGSESPKEKWYIETGTKKTSKELGIEKKETLLKWTVKSSCQTSRCTIEKCPVVHLKPARFSVLTATTYICIKCLSICIFALSALDYYKSTYI